MDSVRIPPRIVDGDLAGWLRDAMAARQLTARMVGLRTGLNHSTISRILQGGREPSVTTLVALLRLLDKPLDAPATNGLKVPPLQSPRGPYLSAARPGLRPRA